MVKLWIYENHMCELWSEELNVFIKETIFSVFTTSVFI